MRSKRNPDLERVRNGYERWRRTQEVPLDLIDSEIEWIVHDTPSGDQLYKGHAGVLDWFRTQEEAFGDFWWEIEELVQAPDGRIVALIVAHATGRASGIATTLSLANVWSIRNNKAIRFEMFLDRDEALGHAGLDLSSDG